MPRDPIADVVTKRSNNGTWVKVGALWHHNTDNRTGIKLLALPVEGKTWAFTQMENPPFLQGDLMCKLEAESDFRTRVGFITTSEQENGGKVVYTMIFDALPLRSPIWLEVKA